MTDSISAGSSGATQGRLDPLTGSSSQIGFQAVSEAPSTSVAAIVGSAVSLPEIEINLTENQKKAICLIYRTIYVDGGIPNATAIWELWPDSSATRGNSNYFRAGKRPKINDIQAYLGDEDFAAKMETIGVNVDLNETGLSVEQIGLLTILTNPTDGRTLKGKLKAAGVTWTMYQSWMKHPKFQETFKKWASSTLMDAIPAAEVQLANLMTSGDMGALRFGMEVTGRHDPANRKQVDGQKLAGLILEVLEEEIKDVELLRRIGNKINLRAVTALE